MAERDYPKDYKDAGGRYGGAKSADVVRDWLRDVGPGEANVARKQQLPGHEKKQDPRR